MKKSRIETVTIHGIANNGFAVGRTPQGMVVFVERGVPGDTAWVELYSKKKGCWYGKISQLEHNSVERTNPYCEHFGICGGCSWQHIRYEEQLRQKEQWVKDAIVRIAKMPDVAFEPILPALETQYYRNKLEFTFSTQRWLLKEDVGEQHGAGALGFHRPGNFNKVVEINHCFHQAGISNELRNFTKEMAAEFGWEYYDLKHHTGYLRNLVLRSNQRGEFMVILSVGYHAPERIEHCLKTLLRKFPEVKSFYTTVNTKLNDSLYDLELELQYGSPYLTEELDHAKFLIGPKSFFQTNPRQASRLFQLVEAFCDMKGGETVLDLYCGVGTIGIYLARKAGQIIGVETIAAAVEDAKMNAQANQLDNCRFFTAEAEGLALSQWLLDKGHPDIIVVDPPRMGLHERVCNELLQIKCKRVVYVSCNPSTQARDLERLSTSYEVVKIRPVDMFPQTNHVESVALLSLRK